MSAIAKVPSAGHNTRVRMWAMIAVTVAAIVLSTSGLISREIKYATDWQIVFFRALALIPAICLAYVLRHRRRTFAELARAGVRPYLVGPVQGLSSICFVVSLTHTSVASVMLMLSATPLFAAGLG